MVLVTWLYVWRRYILHAQDTLTLMSEKKALPDPIALAREEGWTYAAEIVNQLLCFVDMSGRVLFANNFMLRHCGQSAEVAAGKSLDFLVGAQTHRKVFADPLSRAMAGFKQIDRNWVKLNESPARFFEILLHPWRDRAGEVQAVLIAMLNITEQKLLEQRLIEQENSFLDLANATSDWVMRTSPQGAIRYLNPAATEALEEGGNFLLVIHPDDLAEMRVAWEMLLAHGRVANQSTRIIDCAGRLRYVEWSGNLILSRNRETEGCFLVMRDMTRQRHVELLAAEASLTPREIEIVRHVIRGFTNLNIATRLGISEQTVKVHLNSIFRKTQVQNRTELAMRFSGGEDAM